MKKISTAIKINTLKIFSKAIKINTLKIFNTAIIVLLFVFASRAHSEEFFWLNPFPSFLSINASDFVDGTNGWICGDQGFVMNTTNAGESWTQTGTNSHVNFHTVEALSADVVFIGGENGTVLKTDNGGESWQQINIEKEETIFDIGFYNSDKGMVCTKSGIYATNDGGASWELNLEGNSKALQQIEGETFYGAVGKVLYRTSDCGQSWTEITQQGDVKITSNVNDIFFFNENLGWATNVSSSIYKTTDGGVTWSKTWTGLSGGFSTVSFETIFMQNEQIGWAATSYRNNICYTSDGGDTWEVIAIKKYNNYYSINSFDGEKVFFFGENGRIKYTDNPETLESMNPGEFQLNISSISVTSDSEAWALYGGYLFRTTDRGETWKQQAQIEGAAISKFDFVNSETGYALTQKSLYRTTNGGDSWEPLSNIYHSSIYTVKFLDENHGYYLRSGLIANTLILTRDGGFNWDEVTLNGNVRNIVSLDENTAWALTENGVVYTEDFFTNYEVISETSGNGIHFYDENNGIIYRKNAVLYTQDGGVNWEESDVPVNSDWSDCVSLGNKTYLVGTGGVMAISVDLGKTWTADCYSHCVNSLVQIEASSENFILIRGRLPDFLGKTYEGAILLTNKAFSRPQTEIIVGTEQERFTSSNTGSDKFIAAPNPADEFIRIISCNSFEHVNEIRIVDISGKTVQTMPGEVLQNGGGMLDISTLPSGAYFIKLFAGNKIHSLKFVKNHQ